MYLQYDILYLEIKPTGIGLGFLVGNSMLFSNLTILNSMTFTIIVL